VKFLNVFYKTGKYRSEAELLEAYRRTGEIHLIGELFQPYMQLVFSVCYKYLRDDDESKDAVMNIFEKLVDDLKIHQVENFRSWLHRVARNHCLMQIRAKRVFVTSEMGIPEAYESDVFENEVSSGLDESLTLLGKCMAALPNEQRVIYFFFRRNVTGK
jgi:RNA polymerase sigma factor (sigma-70 family)